MITSHSSYQNEVLYVERIVWLCFFLFSAVDLYRRINKDIGEIYTYTTMKDCGSPDLVSPDLISPAFWHDLWTNILLIVETPECFWMVFKNFQLTRDTKQLRRLQVYHFKHQFIYMVNPLHVTACVDDAEVRASVL